MAAYSSVRSAWSAPGIEDAGRIAAVGKVKFHTLDQRRLGIGKVDEDQPADARGRLVHQAAGLAEIDVLRVLADLRDLDRGQLPVKKQLVQNRADQHLERRRGRQPGAGQHRGPDARVKAAQLAAALLEGGGHAAHDRGGGVLFIFVDGQIVQPDLDGA